MSRDWRYFKVCVVSFGCLWVWVWVFVFCFCCCGLLCWWLGVFWLWVGVFFQWVMFLCLLGVGFLWMKRTNNLFIFPDAYVAYLATIILCNINHFWFMIFISIRCCFLCAKFFVQIIYRPTYSYHCFYVTSNRFSNIFLFFFLWSLFSTTP